MAKGCRILDAACGTGYGSQMLWNAGAEYVEGMDLSTEAVEEATELYGHSGIVFRHGNLLNIDSPADSFDLVVSFETVEHIEDDAAYFRELKRVLRDGGLLLCSTPNRTVTNPGKRIGDQPYNPYHIREYTPEELVDAVSPHFSIVHVLGQSIWPESYCKFLGYLGRISSMLPVRVHQLRKLLRSPFDTYSRYAPMQTPSGFQPESILLSARNA